MDSLKDATACDIKSFLGMPKSSLDSKLHKMTGFGQQVRRSVEKEEAEQFFKTRIEQFKDQSRVVQFENVLECSLSLQLVIPLYVHSPYQSFVAATVISSHS